MSRICSSRRLEAETHRNLEVIWLLRRLQPDFKTIADFRRDNREAFRQVFRDFVRLCRELLAVDGTRIKAVNNVNRNFTRAKLERELKRAEERLENYLRQMDEADADAMIAGMSDESGLDMVKVWLPYNRLWAVDFTRSGVNKGSALRVLCDMTDIAPSHTIAVGDSFNDLPLMQTAGLGIAMGNAPSEVRNAARQVVPSVEEDGLAQAIERHIIPLL